MDTAAQLVGVAQGDAHAWLVYTRVLLAVGDVGGAERALVTAERTGVGTRACAVHRGLVVGGRCRFGEAVTELDRSGVGGEQEEGEELEELAEMEKVAIANNGAMCLMQMGRLAEGMDRVEAALRRRPEIALDEGVVQNLGTLYDLGYPDSAGEKRRVLQKLATRFGRQGFDVDGVGV